MPDVAYTHLDACSCHRSPPVYSPCASPLRKSYEGVLLSAACLSVSVASLCFSPVATYSATEAELEKVKRLGSWLFTSQGSGKAFRKDNSGLGRNQWLLYS